jgi:hypothetical protein
MFLVSGTVKAKSAGEMLAVARVSVAKLEFIGIAREDIKGDLFSAGDAMKARDYGSAYTCAARAKRKADLLKNQYRDTCIALASASDCMTEARKFRADIEKPQSLLLCARDSFQKSDFGKAYRYAMESCAETVKSFEANVMVAEPRRGRKPIMRICKWRYPVLGGRKPLCLNMLGRNYRRVCDGETDCEYINSAGN